MAKKTYEKPDLGALNGEALDGISGGGRGGHMDAACGTGAGATSQCSAGDMAGGTCQNGKMATASCNCGEIPG